MYIGDGAQLSQIKRQQNQLQNTGRDHSTPTKTMPPLYIYIAEDMNTQQKRTDSQTGSDATRAASVTAKCWRVIR